MTLYRQSFRVCSRGVSAPRQARVLRQRDSRSSNLHCEMPCPVFENLWHSFVSGTVDVRKFLEQIQIQQEDLQHRHKSLTMIAFSALEIPEKYYVNMMGVFRVLDCLWQVPQAASAVKLLLIGFTKTGAGTFNLANLLPEQENSLVKIISSLLTKKQSCRSVSKLQSMHVPFPVSVPGAESIRPEEFTVGTSLQRNVNAYDDIEFDDTQLQDQANSYRIYINLVARTLRDVPFIKNLSISAELFTFFFENCLADGDIVSAKMAFEALPVLQMDDERFQMLVSHLNINNKQLCADVLINRIHYKRALGQGPSPCEVQLALSLVEECLYIKSQPIDALLISIALEVSTAYYFKSHREEASAQRKKATITRFLVKNHWQLALQVCNTKASQAFLFLELQKKGNYLAAQTVFKTFHLDYEKNHNLVKITAEQLSAQRSREVLTHLQLPEILVGSGVILVNSMETLREAADVLGFQLQDKGKSTTTFPAGSVKAARSSRKNQSAAVIDNSASATTASIDISTTNSSSSSSSACTSSCSGPSVRLYVGVDAEWKATMINNRGHPALEPGAALLQIATPRRVLIFDLHTLGGVGLRGSACKAGTGISSFSPDLTHAAAALLGDLFSAADVVKVGWSFAKSDLGRLRASGRGAFASSFSEVRSVLELTKLTAELASCLDRKNDEALTVREKAFAKKFAKLKYFDYSLSKACSSLLGRPLLKEEQISDWDSVALTSNQLSYAALDAHCLLGLLHSVITGLISAHDGPDKTHREMLLGWTDIDVDGMYVQTDFPDIHDSLDEDRDVDLLESIEVEKEEKGVGNVEDGTTATLCADLDSAEGNGIVVTSSDNNKKIDVIVKKKYRSPAPDTKHFAMSAWLNDSSSKSAT